MEILLREELQYVHGTGNDTSPFLQAQTWGLQLSECNAKGENCKKHFYNEQLCSVVPFFIPTDCAVL